MPTQLAKNLLQKTLRRFGLRVQRIEATRRQIHPSYDAPDSATVLKIIDADPKLLARASSEQRRKRKRWFYDYLSEGRVSFYHEVIDKLEQHAFPFADRRILEFGSFFGVMLRVLAARHGEAQLYGVECDALLVEISERICPQAKIAQGALGDVPFEGTFDLVMLMEVLEHLVDPTAAVEQLDMLAPAGAMLLTVPNGRTDSTPAREFSEEFASYKGHINFWSAESWPHFLRRALPGRTVYTGLIAGDHLYAYVEPPRV